MLSTSEVYSKFTADTGCDYFGGWITQRDKDWLVEFLQSIDVEIKPETVKTLHPNRKRKSRLMSRKGKNNGRRKEISRTETAACCWW